VPTLVAWLLSLATAAAPPAAPAAADPGPASAACAPLVRATVEQPGVAADVRTALALHGAAVRWEPSAGPVLLWVQPRAPLASLGRDDGAAARRDMVLSAATAWRGIVPGLAFRAVADSAAAQVVVTWAGALDTGDGAAPGLAWGAAGRTALADRGGRAEAAHIRLALVAPSGEAYAAEDVRAVARHELGHALGLAHHASATSVMAPRVRAARLHAGDRAALRLLYALPAGARCDAGGAAAR
jgi:hypothetical protein